MNLLPIHPHGYFTTFRFRTDKRHFSNVSRWANKSEHSARSQHVDQMLEALIRLVKTLLMPNR